MVPQLLSNAKAEEIITASDSAIVLTEKSAFKSEDLTEAVGQLKKPKEELVKVIKRKQGSPLTKIVDTNEGLRDGGLKWMFNTVYGGTFALDENIEVHANKLYEVFTRHGLTMYRLPRKQQTAVMASMFEELKSPALAESIQVVGIQHIIDKTQEANQLYLNSEEDRNHDEATKEILKQQRIASKETRDKLDQVVNYLNFISNIKQDAALTELCNEFKELISKTNSAIRARNTRKKKNVDDTE